MVGRNTIPVFFKLLKSYYVVILFVQMAESELMSRIYFRKLLF